MIPGETGRRLVYWGRWAAGGNGLGYPSMSAMMRINAGGRSSYFAEANPDLMRVDRIIAIAEQRHRQVLVRQYCFQGSLRDKARRHGLPKSTYWDLVEEAAWWVHTEYDKPSIVAADRIGYIPGSVGFSSPDYPLPEKLNGRG